MYVWTDIRYMHKIFCPLYELYSLDKIYGKNDIFFRGMNLKIKFAHMDKKVKLMTILWERPFTKQWKGEIICKIWNFYWGKKKKRYQWKNIFWNGPFSLDEEKGARA